MVQRAGGFELTLADDEQFVARKVVVAIGVEHFAYVPRTLSALPASACGHSSAYTDLAGFRDRDVVVIGAGQSALESAALAARERRERRGPGAAGRHRLERRAR